MNRTTIILLAVMVDIAVTVAVVARVIKKRGRLGVLSRGLDKARAFNETVKETTTSFLQSNYSGDPGQLPAVLEQLMLELDEKAQEQGLTLNRQAMKIALMSALGSQNVVPAKDAMDALKKVA